MMKVGLVALLAAPAALAFTPDNLKGVWSCKTLDKVYWDTMSASDATPPVVGTEKNGDDKEQRVVVFDMPESKATRRFSGRSYWLHDGDKDCVEEHDFKGVMKNAIDGSFYLNPNGANAECDGGTLKNNALTSVIKFTTDGTTATTGLVVPKGTKTSDAYKTGWLAPDKVALSDGKTLTNTCGVGQCSNVPEGPWEFTFDDADHFTLTVAPDDNQRGHWFETTKSQYNDRIYGLEKCMRGLAEKDYMCEQLVRSDISTSDEMNAACQGALQCDVCDGGSTGDKCCLLPKQETVQVAYQQPYYYPQPQWGYYPQAPQWGGYYGRR